MDVTDQLSIALAKFYSLSWNFLCWVSVSNFSFFCACPRPPPPALLIENLEKSGKIHLMLWDKIQDGLTCALNSPGCAVGVLVTVQGIWGNELSFRGVHSDEISLTQGPERPPMEKRHFHCVLETWVNLSKMEQWVFWRREGFQPGWIYTLICQVLLVSMTIRGQGCPMERSNIFVAFWATWDIPVPPDC